MFDLRKPLPRQLVHMTLLLFTLAAPAVLSGCLKKSAPAQALALADSLTITGTVTNAAGSPVANAPVYIGTDAAADATTGSDGSFTLTLPSGLLMQLAGSAAPGVNSFYIYAANPTDAKQQVMSAPIDLTLRGNKSLGNLALQQVGSISGTLLQITAGKQPYPAISTNVYAGRASAVTGSDGSFTIAGVAPGSVMMSAAAPLSAPVHQLTTLVAGQALTMTKPLVLFPESGVFGYVLLDPTAQIADFVKAGHPFLRTFDIMGNASAANIRYSEDPTQLGANGTAKWSALTATFDHDFAHDGGSTLYYQFADAGLKNLSPVQQIAVVLDQFAATTGFTIADGSGVIATRDAILHIDVPTAAYRMRIAQAAADLANAPWIQPQATYDFVFKLAADPTNNNQPQSSGNYTVYLEFEDASGLVSPMYQASVLMQLFPTVASSSAIVSINNGATTTLSPLVQLDLQVPANAAEMLIYEASTTTNLNLLFPAATNLTTPNTGYLWLAASPVAFYNFASLGQKTLFVQFRTVDQAVSPVYQYSILFDPFPNGSGGFTVVGGNISATAQLAINLTIPPNATGFQIFEGSDVAQGYATSLNTNLNGTFSGDVGVNAAWLEPLTAFVYTVHAPYVGVHNIYVRYEDANSNVSSAYLQTVTIDASAGNGVGFVINPDSNGNSAVATTNPQLCLGVTPPAGFANSCVTFFDGNTSTAGQCVNPVTTANPSNCPAGFFTYTIQGTGSHTLYAQFTSQDTPLQTSTALAQSIIYEPFPPTAASIVVNGGVTTISAANASSVTLTLTAPPGAVSMKLANDDTTGIAAQTAQSYTSTVSNYALPSQVGIHTVYMQLQDANNNLSPLYSMRIVVTP